MDHHYVKFGMLKKMLKEYRGIEYDAKYDDIKQDAFIDTLYKRNYFIIKTAYSADYRYEPFRQQPLYVILTKDTSKFHESKREFTNLMSVIEEPNAVIMLVTKTPIGTRVKLAEYPHIVLSYMHSTFSTELPKSVHCSKHETDNQEEYKKQLKMLHIYNYHQSLPQIRFDDPMLAWNNAFPGDIVMITALSAMSGKSIHYRYVIGYQPKFRMVS